jgi:hypothetical protein
MNRKFRGCNSVVECQPSKLNVVGSSPIVRSSLSFTNKKLTYCACLAKLFLCFVLFSGFSSAAVADEPKDFIANINAETLQATSNNNGNTQEKNEDEDTVIAPINTDRPTFSDAAVTVDRGSLQIENGIQYKYQAQNKDFVALPETLFRYGLTRRFEIRASLPNLFLEEDNDRSPQFTDLTLSTKIRLGTIGKNLDLGLVLGTNIPTGSSSSSSDNLNPFVRFAYSKPLSRKITALGSLNLGFSRVDRQSEYVVQPALVLYYAKNKKLTLFLDQAVDVPSYGEMIYQIRPGLLYSPHPKHQLDLYCNLGINSQFRDFLIGAGYSFRLDSPKPKSKKFN